MWIQIKIVVLLLCITLTILGHIKTNSILIIYFTTLRSFINISRMNAIHWEVIARQQLRSFEHKLKCLNIRDIYLIMCSSILPQNNDSYTILYRVSIRCCIFIQPHIWIDFSGYAAAGNLASCAIYPIFVHWNLMSTRTYVILGSQMNIPARRA